MPVCNECLQIAEELREAWLDAWLATDPEVRHAWLGLLGGTEDDAAYADEVLSKVPATSSNQIQRVLNMKHMHEARTGHRIPLRPPEL